MAKIIKIIITLLIVAAIYGGYQKYGYLFQSYRNWPSPEEVSTTESLSDITPTPESDAELSFLSLPDGFAITYFAQNVSGARSMTRGDSGVIYVGTRKPGAVYALVDKDSDGRADERHVIATGLREPNGVAYKDGDLYVAEIQRVIVFRNIDDTYADKPSYEVVYSTLPRESHHGWRYMRVGPDGKLYIGIGAPCNVCENNDPFASIISMDTNGSNVQVVARGIRNTVGFDWNPSDNSLWFTDNGRDQMGDNQPTDELNRVGDNNNFGFPYCHQGDLPDPEFGKNKKCDGFAKPAINLGPHVAALGMRFYRGQMFPAEYKNKVIIAEHGSWNRSTPIGYRLMTVNIDGARASNYHEFATGWLDDNGDAIGRPVDVLELSDGSVLISDDFKGAIYRITYSP